MSSEQLARELDQARTKLEAASAEDVLRWAYDRFGDGLVISSSFGIEDVALIDLAHRVLPAVRVFTIDTGRLHEATYEAAERIRSKYGCAVEVFAPERSDVERLEKDSGFYSFRDSLEARHACCHVRKVVPLSRALAGRTAWVTGLRRDQNVTRATIPVVAVDEAHGGIAKINPLLSWTDDDTWNYVRKNGVPYNKLHDEGYPSIGCAPCTRAVRPGEHPRAGRWWWENPEQKECGLHVPASTAWRNDARTGAAET